MPNPCRYDTEHFIFDYNNRQDILTVKIKNEPIDSSKDDEPYVLHYNSHTGVVAVDIKRIFGQPDIPLPSHNHRLNTEFMPWFKMNKDVRPELARALERFYALDAYEAFQYAAPQFEMLLEKIRETYEKIKEAYPKKIEQRDSLKDKLDRNHQDKGISAGNGTTFFSTKHYLWILEETRKENPDKPEYLWRVLESKNPIPLEPMIQTFEGTNHKCFEDIMENQKTYYEITPLELDIINNEIEGVNRVIHQLELILDIPEADAFVDTLEANL